MLNSADQLSLPDESALLIIKVNENKIQRKWIFLTVSCYILLLLFFFNFYLGKPFIK